MKVKSIFISLVLLLSTSFLLSCSAQNEKEEKIVVVKKSNLVTKTIGVEGMTCIGCESVLEKKVYQIEGVVDVEASHIIKEAIVEYDSTKTSLDEITKVIEELGYEVY